MSVMKMLVIFLSVFVSTQLQAGLLQGLKLKVDDTERSYDLYLPDKAASTARPLVILYHGHMGSSAVMTGANNRSAPYKVWLTLAEAGNFIVAVPNGEKGSDGYRGWNDCRGDSATNPEHDDVKFTLRMIEEINRKTSIDSKRIYATGTSNGGNMVIRLAMEVPETFAAVAAVVDSNPVQSECKEKKTPISILFMNGTDDPIMPYGGGRVGKERAGRGVIMSTEASVKYWSKVNQTNTNAELFSFPNKDSRDGGTVTRYSYKGGLQGIEVDLYKIEGGGHTEPSLQERYGRLYMLIVGKQNHDIEMAEEVWNFFQTKTTK